MSRALTTPVQLAAVLEPDYIPICACCRCPEGDCGCAITCDFCGCDHWADEVERVDHLYLHHFWRCFTCQREGC